MEWSTVHKVHWDVYSSHCSVGLFKRNVLEFTVEYFRVYIVQWGSLEFTLFSGIVWSSHCSVGWSGVYIVQWGDLEFTLFSGAVFSLHCSVGFSWVYIVKWSGVHIVQWGGLKFTLFSGVVWSLYCCLKGRVGVWTEDKCR